MPLLDNVLGKFGVVYRKVASADASFSIGLPFRATTAAANPSAATLAHQLKGGLWENSIGKARPTDKVEVLAPTTGTLRVATHNGVEQVTIDSAFDARLIRASEPVFAASARASTAPIVA